MRPMQHRFHQVMDEIRDNKAAYILGGFFILAGLIAGFVSAGKEAPSFRFAVLRVFWGYQTDYQFLSFLWNIGLWRILGWAAYLFCSLWIIGTHGCAFWFLCIPPCGAWAGEPIFHCLSAAISLDGSHLFDFAGNPFRLLSSALCIWNR